MPAIRSSASADSSSRTPARRRRRRLGLAALFAAPLLLAGCARGTTMHVDDLSSDLPDASPGDGRCATVDGACSLRAAVEEANASRGHDRIVLDPGVHMTAGGITLTSPATVVGTLAVLTEHPELPNAGNQLLRADGAALSLQELEFRGGQERRDVEVALRIDDSITVLEQVVVDDLPAAAMTAHDSLVTLKDSAVQRVGTNPTHAVPFPIWVLQGTSMIVDGSSFVDNVGFEAGGIVMVGEQLTVTNSTFDANVGQNGSAGAIRVNEGHASLRHVTISDNIGHDAGGGISTAHEGRVTLRNSIVTDNVAIRGGRASSEDCSTSGGSIVDRGSNVTEAWCGTASAHATSTSVLAATRLGPRRPHHTVTPVRRPLPGAQALAFVRSGCASVDQLDAVRGTTRCDAGAVETTNGEGEGDRRTMSLSQPVDEELLPLLDTAEGCDTAEAWTTTHERIVDHLLETVGLDELPACRHRVVDEPVTGKLVVVHDG